MVSSPTKQNKEEVSRLERAVARLEGQMLLQKREIARLNAVLNEKEKHYLFHLRLVDQENRELSEILRVKKRANQPSLSA
jgi:hypothetical protein